MKTLILLLIPITLFSQTNYKTDKVRSYTKRNGTNVNSYHRTAADKTQRNNYSSKGNTNPYTGKKGYKTPKK
ncbi:MAG TPA: hypothetical protein VK705_05650 [Ferruginibacter sp.]|nr:hypothetical protein [Ferruginibacter sp.]